MKIAVNAKVLAEEKLTGIGVFAYSLLREMDRLTDSLHLFSAHPLKHSPTSTVKCFEGGRGFAYSFFSLPKNVKHHHCDLLFTPREIVPPFLSVPSVSVVHDLYYLFCPKEFRKTIPTNVLLYYRLAKTIFFKRATKILANSEDTKRNVVSLAGISPDKIHVIPFGVDSSFFSPRSRDEIAAVREKYHLHRPYALNTSSVIWERKNLMRMIDAAQHFPHMDVVITGKKGPVYHLIQGRKGVRLLDFVAREDLPALMSGAEALVFPSLHEGFGLPILEAMACGCPVITSDTSGMPEAGGKAALYVDPYDTLSIRNAIGELLETPALAHTLVEEGLKRAAEFTWERTARETLKILKSVV